MAEQFITCPGCGKKIQLTEAFTREIEQKLRGEFEIEQRRLGKQHASELKAKEEEYEEQLAREKALMEKQARKQAEQSVSVELRDLKSQLDDKAKEVEQAQSRELGLRKRIREVEEKEKTLELEVQRKVDAEKRTIWEQATKTAAEQHQLKDAEKEKRIADMKVQIEELKRKAEQGSQQTQGEVLELHLEEVLRAAFQFDTINPVAKGARGADVLQGVRNELGETCGSILWEAKTAKNWSDGWVQKLKDDQREAKADIAVIISTSLPKDVAHVGQADGIWVADVQSAIGLATALREGLIHLAQARRALIGKNTKMEAIYNYLSGPEFRQRVESIVGSFASMQEDLNAEKRAMERAWAKREKQISRVIENTAQMYGDLQGMIGASLPEIKVLELPSGEQSKD
jgi:hypothetical protein